MCVVCVCGVCVCVCESVVCVRACVCVVCVGLVKMIVLTCFNLRCTALTASEAYEHQVICLH